ncbi:hypothetical protein [Mesorhizobium sp. WSM3882]|uniref:hypothetical protein n=1 Tax=Mesorhizobium sp. WSM3882 TaxID=2029407 RepID=UPI000BAEB7ED|nr:hypothetical protein [Mesorhizobium sp. WSM3882]PBB34337.1 hypothetical protein CK214_08495 [Mesorhizobium sp. WSM3882]
MVPGYNHYPDCPCGWCVKYGGGRISRNEISYSIRLADARSLLRAHGVRDRVVACFVDPNAKCPVCGAPVYYYQNARGSRVFFDDLGPPWPKHACTDNQRGGYQAFVATSPRPKARRRGLSIELVEAAQQTGLYDERFFYGSGQSEHWTPIEVLTVTRRDQINDVEALYLETADRETIKFRFQSENEVIQTADVIMKRNNQISIFSAEDMADLLFEVTLVG